MESDDEVEDGASSPRRCLFTLDLKEFRSYLSGNIDLGREFISVAHVAMPRCYMVKKGTPRHEERPSPCSPTEASIAPPYYSPTDHSTLTEPRSTGTECAEERTEEGCVRGAGIGNPTLERSAADTEAALDLLSLAAGGGVPPALPVLTVLRAPDALPLYSYSLQPTNFYIISEEPEPYYHTVQTVTPVSHIDYSDQVSYITYQPHEQSVELAPLPPESEQVVPLVYETDQDEVPEPCSEESVISEDIEITTSPATEQPRKEKAAWYDCDECGKRYATSSNLSRHKQTHRSLDSGSAKRCGECGKAYVSMPALAMHVLTHRMGHVCGVCGKQFSRPWLLRGHLRSHTGEKPYVCGSCGKPFADRSNLRAHLQTHLREKRYECLRCHKPFALKSYLNKHLDAACSRDEEGDD